MSKIFISYRHKGGSILGQLLFYRLKEDGYDVFFDTESMKAGRFDQQLLQNIDESDIFLSLLTENALDRCMEDGDFVRLEIAHAIAANKKIILIMDEDFQFPKELPEDINDIRFYQGIKVNLNFAEAFYQKVLAFINKTGAESKDASYDFYEELERINSQLFPDDSDQPESAADHETADNSAEKDTAKASMMDTPDASPEPEFYQPAFCLFDKHDMTTLCFQVKKQYDKNHPEKKYCYLILLPVDEEWQRETGTIKSFMPVYESGVIKDTMIDLTFLTIKEKTHEAILNCGDYCNNTLRINQNPGVIKYHPGKPDLPEDWVQDSMLDMSEFESEPQESVKEFISPYSPEKLQYVLVDPDTKQVVRPKMIRGKDGGLYLKIAIIRNHSYIIVQTVSG